MTVISRVAIALVAVLSAEGAAIADPAASVSAEVPPSVVQAIRDFEAKPVFAHMSWGIHLVDLATGKVLIDQAGNKSLLPASVMKTYSVATALDLYGADYRFRTSVYRLGTVKGDVLDGDLVLVASGDFSFGLREQPNGKLGFNSLPEVDHNTTYTGFPGGAYVRNSDPLAALDALAAQVKAAGIREITGDVMIDDRLFETYRGFPSGPIAPIWVNENVIDIMVTPTKPGEKPKVDWRPKSAAVTVENEVTTVAGTAGPLEVTTQGGGVVRVSGKIASDGPPILTMSQIADATGFARTVFIEALVRAGVRVATRRPGPAGSLPVAGAYSAGNRVAEHVSPPLSEFVKVILKVSYNRGADLMVCLAAVKAGSRDCGEGLAEMLKLLARHGVSSTGTYVFDGAGSSHNSRTTPSDLATFLREITTTPWGSAFHDGMAVLGVDGSQALNGAGSPAAAQVRIKDGDMVAGSAAGQLVALATTQTGYIAAKSGRLLVYSLMVNNIPFLSLQDYSTARADVAAVVVAIQQGY
ncbi:D-alanyl-D-alanine carboxypeptidase/D-alanyl-D-alanine endopeptidase [Bosea rubneri]|uniref:D-alanyl-D-alanine carboxypeptidase/D-alanyl-D-alanine-endopeptidase n=1 Tax=Bosea rubneri TaxID=3075434 RepID=A0ABU3SD85_9HYPH|nr:D-alanyl-D-alanine carboxypeptidase/D-alanyl-D-alanine-endopeptidase [Bosea sp. ZW T0_25]MDU0342357.1 D-alanyl-D-alanine carboxypeptidase/D-alanyl-D-alanine-endopeptidase [Bosea sp. ZW T0_25]